MKPPGFYEAKGYEFANRIWLARPFGERPVLAHIFIFIFSLAPILIGLIVSFVAGFNIQFAKNWAIYYGAVGIYLTTAAIWHGSKDQYKIYDVFLSCFDLTEDERQTLLRDTLESYADTRRQLKSVAVTFLVGVAIAAIGFWHKQLDPVFGNHGIATVFCFEDFRKAGWYLPENRKIAFGLTVLFAFCASIPLGTAYRLMLKMPGILFKCARSGSTLLPRLIKMHFTPLTKFYTRISLLWSGGLLLFFLLFRHNHNWLFAISLGFIAILGIINFVVPQIIYIRVVSGAEDFWLEQAGEESRQTTKGNGADVEANSKFHSQSILNISSYFMTHDHWVYPVHEVYGVVVAQLLSLFGLLRTIIWP